jgi:hypothetical protein
MEVVVNRDEIDLAPTRITYEEYLLIPRKGQTGRASQYSIKRDVNNITISLWPIPENATDILKIETISELQDVNKSESQNAEIPKRFLPPLTCGLSYYMAMKRPGVDQNRIMMLKQNYEELLGRAFLEDRQRASLFLLPRLGYI